MTIKKGLAVIDSNGSTTHKLMDDGEVNVGKTGAQVDLKGEIYLGQNSNDQKIDSLGSSNGELVGTLRDLESDIETNAKDAAETHRIDQGTENNSQADDLRDDYLDSTVAGSQASIISAAVALENTNRNASFGLHSTEIVTTQTTEVTTLKNNVQTEISDEITAQNTAFNGASGLQSVQIKAAKDAVDLFTVVSNASADTDTFKEVVELIEAESATNATELGTEFDTLSTMLVDEGTIRSTNDATLVSNIGDEVTARQAQSGALDTRIDAMIGERTGSVNDLVSLNTSMLGDITSSYKAADIVVAANIKAESDAREGATTALSSSIDTHETTLTTYFNTASGNIAQETEDRIEAYNSLKTVISTVKSNQETIVSGLEGDLESQAQDRAANIALLEGELQQDLADFKTATEAENALLVAELNTVVGNRQTADNNISGSISTMVAAFKTQSDTVDNNIATEKSNRESAYSGLRNSLQTVTEANIDAIVAGASIDFDELSEIVNHINTEMSGADGEMRKKLVEEAEAVIADIHAEVTAAVNADSTVYNNMLAELNSVNSDNTAFQNLVSSYRTGSAANELLALSSSVKSDYDGDLSSFESTLNTTTGSLLDLVEAEAQLREAGDLEVQGWLTTEEQDEITALTNESGFRAKKDGDMTTQLQNFESTGFNGSNITVTGANDTSLGDLILAPGATAQVGVLTSPPTLTTPASDQNGMMFYLDMDPFTASGPFTENKKWYFCENGVWHMSPFYVRQDSGSSSSAYHMFYRGDKRSTHNITVAAASDPSTVLHTFNANSALGHSVWSSMGIELSDGTYIIDVDDDSGRWGTNPHHNTIPMGNTNSKRVYIAAGPIGDDSTLLSEGFDVNQYCGWTASGLPVTKAQINEVPGNIDRYAPYIGKFKVVLSGGQITGIGRDLDADGVYSEEDTSDTISAAGTTSTGFHLFYNGDKNAAHTIEIATQADPGTVIASWNPEGNNMKAHGEWTPLGITLADGDYVFTMADASGNTSGTGNGNGKKWFVGYGDYKTLTDEGHSDEWTENRTDPANATLKVQINEVPGNVNRHAGYIGTFHVSLAAGQITYSRDADGDGVQSDVDADDSIPLAGADETGFHLFYRGDKRTTINVTVAAQSDPSTVLHTFNANSALGHSWWSPAGFKFPDGDYIINVEDGTGNTHGFGNGNSKRVYIGYGLLSNLLAPSPSTYDPVAGGYTGWTANGLPVTKAQINEVPGDIDRYDPYVGDFKVSLSSGQITSITRDVDGDGVFSDTDVDDNDASVGAPANDMFFSWSPGTGNYKPVVTSITADAPAGQAGAVNVVSLETDGQGTNYSSDMGAAWNEHAMLNDEDWKVPLTPNKVYYVNLLTDSSGTPGLPANAWWAFIDRFYVWRGEWSTKPANLNTPSNGSSVTSTGWVNFESMDYDIANDVGDDGNAGSGCRIKYLFKRREQMEPPAIDPATEWYPGYNNIKHPGAYVKITVNGTGDSIFVETDLDQNGVFGDSTRTIVLPAS